MGNIVPCYARRMPLLVAVVNHIQRIKDFLPWWAKGTHAVQLLDAQGELITMNGTVAPVLPSMYILSGALLLTDAILIVFSYRTTTCDSHHYSPWTLVINAPSFFYAWYVNWNITQHVFVPLASVGVKSELLNEYFKIGPKKVTFTTWYITCTLLTFCNLVGPFLYAVTAGRAMRLSFCENHSVLSEIWAHSFVIIPGNLFTAYALGFALACARVGLPVLWCRRSSFIYLPTGLRRGLNCVGTNLFDGDILLMLSESGASAILQRVMLKYRTGRLYMREAEVVEAEARNANIHMFLGSQLDTIVMMMKQILCRFTLTIFLQLCIQVQFQTRLYAFNRLNGERSWTVLGSISLNMLAILLSFHDVPTVESLCDRVLITLQRKRWVGRTQNGNTPYVLEVHLNIFRALYLVAAAWWMYYIIELYFIYVDYCGKDSIFDAWSCHSTIY